MKIKKVDLYRKEMPMICGKFTCSTEPGVDNAEIIITRIETEDGLVGYGESGSVGAYPNYALGILHSSAELIKRHLMDKDPLNINSVQQAMNLVAGHGEIKTGFDIACWDILGKASNKPLYELLGGRVQEKAPLYRSITTDTPDEMLRFLKDWRLEGYRKFQMRVGQGDIHMDLNRIRTLLAEKHTEELFTIDVAGNWRTEDAISILNQVKEFDFTIEQPCWTLEECITVRQHIGYFPMKLDNCLNSVGDVLHAYRRNACDNMVIHINKFGGLTPACTVRDIAIAANLGLTYSTQWGTEITTAALTHLALTTPARNLISSIDAHNYSPVLVAKNNAIEVDNGDIWMRGDTPGLGVVVNDEALGEAIITIQG